jgi:outer membrane protein assembly factor BamB
LFALDGATGSIRWERPAENPDPAFAQYAGYAYPILAPGGVLLVVAHAPYAGSTISPRGKLMALDAATGQTRWETAVRAEIASAPAVAEDGTIYAVLGTGACCAFDGANGLIKWGLSLGSSGSDSLPTCPVNIGTNGWIYFTGINSNALFAVQGGAAGGLARTDWPRYQANARNTGSLAPEQENRAPVFAAIADPVLAEETMLILTNAATDPDGALDTLTYTLVKAPEGMTMDPATGTIRWQPTEAQGPAVY